MKLLVTNTQRHQAYAIVRALRPHADTIVATMAGRTRLHARFSTAACSRLVDKRYHVPSPEADWLAGRVQRENTGREEAYVRRLLDICEQESIDTLFPSYDPQVYVLSKNKERFARRGILVPVPDFNTVRVPLDKYRTMLAAQKAGFPHPQTFLPETEEDLRQVAASLPGPWVIRPRLTAGSKGMEIATTVDELLTHMRQVQKAHHQPLVQEYVPGNQKQNFYLVVDRDGEMVSFFSPRSLRCVNRLYRDSTLAAESSWKHDFAPEVAGLVRRIGFWGGLTVQTKIDVRDNTPKLMEINPRLGTHLWYRTELGVNEPLLNIQIGRGEKPKPLDDRPEGTLLLQPLEDVIGLWFELLDMAVYKYRRMRNGTLPVDAHNVPPSMGELFGAHWRLYTSSQQKIFSPYAKYLFSDPLPGLMACHGILKYSIEGLGRLGR